MENSNEQKADMREVQRIDAVASDDLPLRDEGNEQRTETVFHTSSGNAKGYEQRPLQTSRRNTAQGVSFGAGSAIRSYMERAKEARQAAARAEGIRPRQSSETAGYASHVVADRSSWSDQFKDLMPHPDIEWDPFIGCTPPSTGCRNCYAAARVAALVKEHPSIMRVNGKARFTGKVFFSKQMLHRPLVFTRKSIIFFCAHCDPYHPAIEYDKRAACFDVMHEADWHQFNVLTKYTKNAVAFHKRYGPPSSNVRIGFSAEDQPTFAERFDDMMQIEHNGLRIISLQPLINRIVLPDDIGNSWVVAMREVGDNPRYCAPQWFSSLREQCFKMRVPFFWEVTGQDTKELVAERINAVKDGRPYDTIGVRIGLPMISVR